MERENFEDSWKKAFEKAEVSPSSGVWTNIELGLERANGSKLKRRLVIFQLLAAASVIFIMGLGVGIFVMKNSYEESAQMLAAKVSTAAEAIHRAEKAEALAQSKTNKQSQSSSLIELNGKTSTISTSTVNPDNTQSKRNLVARAENLKSSDLDRGMLTAQQEQRQMLNGVFAPYREGSLSETNHSNLPSIVEVRKIRLSLPEPAKAEADPVQLMLARLEQRELEVRDEEKRGKRTSANEKLWTSVGFSAGSFNAVNAGVSNRQASSDFYSKNASIAKSANTEAKASGTSYTIGANIGTKLSPRWVFQGGVNYLTQSSDYTASSAVIHDEAATSFRPASINELDKLSVSDVPAEEKLVSTAPYNVNNSLRYLSIPMQAGYMVINKNFGLQLNAGVATDLFLQNTVSAEGGSLDKTSQGIGENSPYRSFNLSGLAGTEISYRFSKNYRVALNPGLRYPFNSIYRSEVAVQSTPITFDIGLRFRYIFH